MLTVVDLSISIFSHCQLQENTVTHPRNFTWKSKYSIFINGLPKLLCKIKAEDDYNKALTQYGKEVK